MAAAARGGLGFASLILIAASIVFMFFVILAGVSNTTPLNKTYFIQIDTSALQNAPRPLTQVTYFYNCGAGNKDCSAPVPALPIGYSWLGASGVPSSLTGSHAKHTTSTYYYYMWRFGWVFYLMALVTNVLGFFTAILAPCFRIASGITGLLTLGALFWMSLAASLMTAVFVKERDRFTSAGISAHLGRYGFGFTWGAWACIFLACLFSFFGTIFGRSADRERSSAGSNVGFFRRQRSTRSRGSFIDTESQRRVKEEY